MIIHANCKINLGLNITHRRSDGFHELCTVMIPVKNLYDVIEIELFENSEFDELNELDEDLADNVIFENIGLKVDCAAEDNLCIKAAKLMLDQCNFNKKRVKITLDKRVPFGAGLGGGSSDATAVIIALNKLLELNLSEDRLIDLAATLGSDTAFFVRNTPQFCRGRGEIMEPMPKEFCSLVDKLRIEIVKPNDINISTKEAFAGINIDNSTDNNTIDNSQKREESSLIELLSQPIETWQSTIKNDFEPHIFAKYPELQNIKQRLQKEGAIYTAMSGSGSAIFAFFL